MSNWQTRALVDGTWAHYYEPESKAQSQSRQWVGSGFLMPKKFKIQPSGHSLLGHKKVFVGLFTQEKYNNWSVLCKLARPAENRHS